VGVVFGGTDNSNSPLYGPRQPFDGGSGPNTTQIKDNGVKTGTFTIRDKAGPLTAEVAKQWLNQQIPYENIAGRDDGADQRIVKAVDRYKRIYQEKTLGLRKKWRYINHMLRGNSVSKVPGMADIHVPELYKRLETACTRIHEAVKSYSDWFKVQGREPMDKTQAALIQEFIRWQCEEGDFEDIDLPAIRSLFTYQIAIAKVEWNREIDRRPKTEVKEVPLPDGGFDYTFTRTIKDEVVFDGPIGTIVDPLNFFIDTTKANPKKALFVGDTCRMTRGDILKRCESGVWKNGDLVKNLTPRNLSASEMEHDKMLRSITEKYGQGLRGPEGAPEEFDVTEVWCKYDLYGDGRELECKLVTVDDKVCVCAIENFYDSKKRPYSIAVWSKEGFDLFGVGPLDHAVRLNEELDHHRQLALEAHKISVCPAIFAEEDADLPDSMLGILPGSVFTGVGKVAMTNAPDTLRSMPQIEGTLKLDIQETTGVPDILQGTDASGGANTATEIERRIQEGNKRLLGGIRAFSGFQEQILNLIHGMNQQFVLRRQKFRVLGKAAKFLGAYAEIKPTDFQKAVDFTFVGVANVHTIGTRATAIANYLTVSAPYVMQNADLVNVPLLLQEFYDLTIGRSLGDDIVNVPSMLSTLMPPEEENYHMLAGTQIRVDDLDDDESHLRKHGEAALQAKEDKNEYGLKLIMEHMMNHALNARRKQVRQQAAKSRTPTTSQSQPPPGENDAGDAPVTTSPLSGSSGGSPAQTQPGETPGPPSLQTMNRPGRSNAIPQTSNMAQG